MNKNDYKLLFERIAPDPELIKRTEKEIEKQMNANMIKRPARVLLIAALISVLAIGAALAVTAQNGILTRLFTNAEPSEAAKAAMVYGADKAESEGITLTLDECLIDQSTVNIAWTVQSERNEPVYYITEYEIEGSSEGALYPYGGSSSEVGDCTLVALSPSLPSYSGYASSTYEAIAADTVASVTIHAYTSKLTPVQVNSFGELYWANESEETRAAYWKMEESGTIGITPEGLAWIYGYQAVRDAESRLPETEDRYFLALSESGLMEPLTSLTVRMKPENRPLSAMFHLDQPVEFRLPGKTVQLKTLTFDLASTLVEYDVVLEGEHHGEAAYTDGNRCLLETPDGTILNTAIYLNMSANSSMKDGKTIISYTYAGNPMTELPDSIRFIPAASLERREGESSADYYRRMADLAKPEETFIIFLK